VQIRDSGISQREYVARVAKLNVILDCARLEDFAVANENRSLTDVALGMLGKAGGSQSDPLRNGWGSLSPPIAVPGGLCP